MTGEWLYQPAGFDPDMYADLPAVEVQWAKREDGWYCRIKSAKRQSGGGSWGIGVGPRGPNDIQWWTWPKR